jgi:enoyl-CoA hydratase/carnithine racemase
MTTSTRITRERRGHLLLIGLNRPEKRNAFDLEMLHAFAQAFTDGDADPEVRCLVVFAHGDHFTGGLDLAQVAPAIMGPGGEGTLFPKGQIDPWGVHGRMRTTPLVTAVQGRCLTLGIELLLASDIAIAASDTRFAQIEIKRGIFPFGGATWRLPQTAGRGNAMRWLLTGDEFDAAEALRLGLVQEVVPEGKPLERAIELAETISRQAPLGVKATLESARLFETQGPEATAKALLPRLRELAGSEDAREGMMSFLERREAKFVGR